MTYYIYTILYTVIAPPLTTKVVLLASMSEPGFDRITGDATLVTLN